MFSQKAITKLNAEDALKLSKSDWTTGLSHDRAKTLLEQYGYNEIPEKKRGWLFGFLKKFCGLSAWMLELIIIISLILHKASDALIVTGLLVLNAIISFAQENRAEFAVELLKKNLQVYARVLRDGLWKTIPARELVPGDVVRIRIGDFVPADIKIKQGETAIDQSTLTGESLEVERKIDEVVYAGSIVRRGEADGIVMVTGAKTYYGKTVQLVEIAMPKLHAESLVSQVTKLLLIIVVILILLALGVSLWWGVGFSDILPLSLVLLLGAIPVALPVMFTVSMAFGSLELTRRGVLVTRLDSLYDAARMDVLCVDKTGTLTTNEMSIAKVIGLDDFSEDEVLRYGALASREANNDPLDRAFLKAIAEKNIRLGNVAQISFVPFDPKTRRTEALIQDGEKQFQVMKGSLEALTGICGLREKDKERLNARVEELIKRGYRILAVAKQNNNERPKLVGLTALHDPLKKDAGALIIEIKKLGLSVKMLTGDMLAIAREIAKTVGVGERITKITELKERSEKNPLEAAKQAEGSDGFAEIYPEDKYLIVSNFQKRNHIVGMTGDGVNDAAALKQAEFGIATANATDVAKNASGIVLTDGGLISIIDAIKTGRMIFERVNVWILNKISRTILKTCFVVSVYLATGKFVISATAMLIMIFMTDFVKISLATDNARWSEKPAKWNICGLGRVAAVLGIIMVAEAFGLLFIGFTYFGLSQDTALLNTFSFELLLFFALFSILSVRDRRHFWDSVPSKPFLFFIIADMILGVVLSTFGLIGFKAIPLYQSLFVICYAFVFSLFVNDLIKLILLKKFHYN